MMHKIRKTHGSGKFKLKDFRKIGKGVVIEQGVLVFHPENIIIGDNVYIGHNTILKGYFNNTMVIGQGTWIGQQCFLHSGGGLVIGENVGIGPAVKILTSSHETAGSKEPILHNRIIFKKVGIGSGCDIGVGAIILPGCEIGENTQVGAGAVVAEDLPADCVAAGVPAKILKKRQ